MPTRLDHTHHKVETEETFRDFMKMLNRWNFSNDEKRI